MRTFEMRSNEYRALSGYEVFFWVTVCAFLIGSGFLFSGFVDFETGGFLGSMALFASLASSIVLPWFTPATPRFFLLYAGYLAAIYGGLAVIF